MLYKLEKGRPERQEEREGNSNSLNRKSVDTNTSPLNEPRFGEMKRKVYEI